jgi:hypothetical protein
MVEHTAASTLTAKATVSVRGSVATELWVIWAEIAIEQSRLAREARPVWVAQREAGEEWDMNIELKPAMVAITACAASLDGFEALVKQEGVQVPQPPGKEPGRADWIWATLRASFDVKQHTNRWLPALNRLFALRNVTGGGLVHPKTVFDDPSKEHPVVPGVSVTRATYTRETADEALALLREIYGACRGSVLPTHTALANRIANLDATLAKLTASD